MVNILRSAAHNLTGLILLKGDLNYRKLLADREWTYTSDFGTATTSFPKTSFAALRTNKSTVIAGLALGVAEALAKSDPEWLYAGRFGVIQGVFL
jgi:hypothetical protein